MKCPDCNEQLTQAEIVGVEPIEDNFFIQFSGKCPECKKKYLWVEKFKSEGRAEAISEVE